MCGLTVDTGSCVSAAAFQTASDRISHRGPDTNVVVVLPQLFVAPQADATIEQSDIQEASDGVQSVKLGFYRLSIMDPTHQGDQPFANEAQTCFALCNGEIYNHSEIREALLQQGTTTYQFHSHSDCEVLLPLYQSAGIMKMAQTLDGEFAVVIVDYEKKDIFAVRDPMSIRPLFYGKERRSGHMMFASEAKVLQDLCDVITPFPPGCVYSTVKNAFTVYCDVTAVAERPSVQSVTEAQKGIRERFVAAVTKRLHADVPLGFLLSGGLDSSLVCAIAASQSTVPLVTFAVGLYENPIDIKYAREMATHIQSDHHEVYFSMDEVRDHLGPLIRQLETWDVTTIRASIGMSLLCKYIREKTSIRVVLTGEVSDELFGYKYTDYAPSPQAFQEEAEKRVKELFMYDVLRADRCIAWHSLEARVPFSDTEFVQYVTSIAPELKMNTTGTGKWLLRSAFDGAGYPIPDSILWREKAAFSDAVGHGMVDHLQADAAAMYTDEAFEKKRMLYPQQGRPLTKEGLMYREIFESFYPGRSAWVADHWLPNQSWDNCCVVDPSARALPNYGASGI